MDINFAIGEGMMWFASAVEIGEGGQIAPFMVSISHLHYNVIQHVCEAISG